MAQLLLFLKRDTFHMSQQYKICPLNHKTSELLRLRQSIILWGRDPNFIKHFLFQAVLGIEKPLPSFQ